MRLYMRFTQKKIKGILLKFDYEKADDRVSWEFLEQMITQRGYSQKWINKLQTLIYGGSVGIRLNDSESSYRKGLRQGDPLSPILFNLVDDIFTRICLLKQLTRTLSQVCCLVLALVVSSVCGMLMIDTLIFLKNDLQMAQNLKWVLTYSV